MNIKAVARRAGVSTATVSRTINGSDKVSPKTAEKVQKAIAALNFYPNTNARALGSGRSSLYGLIISDITNPFFPELVKAFEDIAVEHGQEVLVANTNYDPQRMEMCVTRMLQRKVDGLAIMTSEMDDRLLDVVSQREIPLVSLDTITPALGWSSVRMDYAAGIRMGLEHLTALGHTRVGFLSGPMRLSSARERVEAYRNFMDEHGFAVPPEMVQEGNHRIDGGRAAMQRVLDAAALSGVLPTAMMASNDLTAIGALGAIHDAGLRVPQDISLIGYDDIQLSAYIQPPLTTLRLSRVEIATAAFRALFNARRRSAGERADSEDHIVQPIMILRRSTGPAKD
ncbi:LacI family DNA-binding transcriptional regulator [Granulicella arctica]|uniref:LacI family DNA-binding transcriptional regulator n=1 Tax=Granulicella arctica TaxID=940613 RepID=UPI0021E0B1D7|nr:LacI family DNA-binding transcriptional regulator [Granulicella arctica]